MSLGETVEVFGDTWHFTPNALEALEAKGPVTPATIKFCAINLGTMEDLDEGDCEIDYYGVPLLVQHKQYVIVVDATSKRPN